MITITPSNGIVPQKDGDIMLYETPQKGGVTEWYKAEKRAIYINGQMTSGQQHMESALALSLLQMCPVIGVFNQSASTWALVSVILDTCQSLGDKRQFHGPGSGGPEGYFESYLALLEKRTGRKPDRGQAMEELLQRNRATLSTFRLLRSGTVPRSTPIFAHSQGNIILSNALTALALVDGPSSVSGIVVHSFGNPTVNWPKGVKHFDCAFTGDLVALLNPMLNFSISKVGLPSGVNPLGFISHGFMLYLQDDAQFVINRFRWGGWGMTVHMDEEGLTSALVAMGDNEPRLRNIFLRLDAKHNSDVDDVACAYVKKMMADAKGVAALKKMKMNNAPLIPLLIRVMDEGWTTDEEKSCIQYLKSL